MRLMHAGLRAYIPGETITPAAGAGDLLVALSCTGETGFTGYMARRAHDHGASITVVTSEPNSALARQADRVVHLPVEAETIVTRAAVFEHTASLCLDAVFSLLSERLRIDEETYRRRHANLE
jgi:6-phospho-3-hexuloisomerase